MTDSLILFALNHPHFSYKASAFLSGGAISAIVVVIVLRLVDCISWRALWVSFVLNLILFAVGAFSLIQLTRTLSPSEISKTICMISSEDQVLLKNRYFPLQASFHTIQPTFNGIGTALADVREDEKSRLKFDKEEQDRVKNRDSIREALEGCSSDLPPKVIKRGETP